VFFDPMILKKKKKKKSSFSRCRCTMWCSIPSVLQSPKAWKSIILATRVRATTRIPAAIWFSISSSLLSMPFSESVQPTFSAQQPWPSSHKDKALRPDLATTVSQQPFAADLLVSADDPLLHCTHHLRQTHVSLLFCMRSVVNV
jgi:hypothetical protein